MATVIKKISELENLEELTSASNVIIEENGKAKRFSAQNIGKVKTVNGIQPDENGNIEVEVPEAEIPEINYPVTSVNGMTGDVVIEIAGGGSFVQPDWNQSDESAADYVKNRTHFVRSEGMSITWDGDTSTIDTFVEVPEMGNLYYVSDQTPSNDCLQNGLLKIHVAMGEETMEQEMPLSDMWMDIVDSGLITDSYAFLRYAMVARFDNVECMGITFPRAGTYFLHMEMGEGVGYISEFGVPEDVQTIDPKFLPDFAIIGKKGTGENSEIFNSEENTASGDYSHAEGDSTQAYGSASHTEGCGTTAYGSASHAEGIGTFAYGQFSHAEGGTNENADNEVVSGAAGATKYTSTDFTAEVGWVLGYNDVYARITYIAQDSETGVYTITLDKTLNQYSELVDVSVMAYPHVASGHYSHAEGSKTTAFGIASHAEGYNNVASGLYSHVEGNTTKAIGEACHAEGKETKASGLYTHAEGYLTESSVRYTHAEGWGTKASSEASHAEGKDTVASGRISHAEGYNNVASGDYSHAEGASTQAVGWVSHAEGQSTYAGGYYSHAEGYNTKANGQGSHAEGFGTIAIGEYQHVQGRGNIQDTDGKYAHIVGNGTVETVDMKLTVTNPSNAHTVDWYGNGWYAGSIEGTAVILKSPNGNRFKVTVSDDGTLSANAIAE